MKNRSGTEETVFTVLNPVAQEPERTVQGLNPRLDTLKGKKVNVINLHGGNEEAIESVARDLLVAVPACNVEYYRTGGGHGAGPLSDEDWARMVDCDAAILGHAF